MPSLLRKLFAPLTLTVAFCIASWIAPPCFGQTDLSGYWDVRTPNQGQDGTFRDTYLELHQAGEDITGTLLRRPNGIPLKGTFKDGAIHLETVPPPPPATATNPARPPQRPLVFDGTYEDGKLLLTSRGRYGETKSTAEKVTREATLPPAPRPLPELKDLPDNGLARTPPMGWNSWNKFAGRIDDASVRAMADAMVSNGMSKVGYTYINIDDTWELGRDANGNITSNKKVSRHEGARRLRALEGPEDRDLFKPRTEDLRRIRRQLRA